VTLLNRRLLVISAGIVHPSWLARKNLRRILLSIKDYEYVFSSSIESFKELSCKKYEAVILYFHRQHTSAESLKALDEFVKNGGGLLAIHSASASFKKYPQYFDILGGRFIDHGKIEEYVVRPSFNASMMHVETAGDARDASGSVPLFSNIDEFTVKDELYFHEYHPKNEIHFYVEKDGKKEPVVWTRRHGKGRVCYLAIGHRAQTLKNPCIQKLIHSGLYWICLSASAATTPLYDPY